jgi:hypothetical protein
MEFVLQGPQTTSELEGAVALERAVGQGTEVVEYRIEVIVPKLGARSATVAQR